MLYVRPEQELEDHGMSRAANKVSSIDRGLNVVTCLAQRLMGNYRLALWDLLSSIVSVASCCFSSDCHWKMGAGSICGGKHN